MPETSTSRERLVGYVTGKRALSLRLFPFFALASFYGSIALEPTFANGHKYRWLWVLVAVIGYLSVFLTWLIVKLLIGDIEKRNFKVWHSFFISGLGGAVQGLTIALLIDAFGIPDHVGHFNRMLSGFVILLFWLPLSAILSANLQEFSTFRADAIRELTALERVRLEMSGLAQNIRRSVEKDLHTSLTISTLEARRQYDKEVDSLASINTQIPEILRETAQKDVRELVHDIMSRVNPVEDKGREVSDLQVRSRPFFTMFTVTLRSSYPHPAIVILITLTTLLPIEFRNDPLGKACVVSLILLGTFALLHSVGYTLWKFKKSWAPIVYLFSVGLTQALPLGIINQIYPEGIGLGQRRVAWSVWGGYQTLSLAVVGVGILVPLCTTILISRDDAMKAFQRDFDVERARQQFIDTEVSIFTRKWAQKVHGSLQSQLAAAALTIERASSSGDMEALATSIASARMLLETPVSIESEVGAPPRTLEEEIVSRCALWESLIDISSAVDYQGTPLSARVQSALGDAIEEAISNAVRHGGATAITITGGRLSTDELTLAIRDNGTGILSAPRGFGSEVFDRLAGDNWSLTRDGEETVLLLRFPIPA